MTEAEWLASDDPGVMLTWLTATHGPSGYYVRHNNGRPIGDRKLRLFACACCRQVWGRITDEWSQRAVIIAERNVDGLDDKARMPQMHQQAFRVPGSERPGPLMAAAECCNPDAIRAAHQARQLATCPQEAKAALLREIVGNPFRSTTLPKCLRCAGYKFGAYGHGGHTVGERCTLCSGSGSPWLSPTVLSLAEEAYRERQPFGTLNQDRLAVLADALEDAGCTDEAILKHLRGWELIRTEYKERGEYGWEALERTEWVLLRSPHYAGCWALDLILGKE